MWFILVYNGTSTRLLLLILLVVFVAVVKVTWSFLGVTQKTLSPEMAHRWNSDPNSYPDSLPEVLLAPVPVLMPPPHT